MSTLTILLVFTLLTLSLSRPIARGKKCDPAGEECATGLSCIVPAPPRKPRCYMKMPVGKQCAVDPFWVCEDHLVCMNNICKIPIEGTGKCENIANSMCRPPLSCVGPRRKKRCYMKKPPGMRCGVDPFWVCQDGLACREGVCVMELRGKQKCEVENKRCKRPFKCVGPKGKKRCYMKKPLGMKCGVDPFWVCRKGLKCVGDVCVTAWGW